MESFGWTPSMALGIAVMDKAHHAFVDDLSDLLEMPDEGFEAALSALIASMERDFREEEELMETHGLSCIHGHREQHARVLAALHSVVPAAMRGETASAREVVKLVPPWFMLHLSTMDAVLAQSLDEGAPQPASTVSS